MALHENRSTGEVTADMSSWGGTVSLNLNEVVHCYIGFGGQLYFDK